MHVLRTFVLLLFYGFIYSGHASGDVKLDCGGSTSFEAQKFLSAINGRESPGQPDFYHGGVVVNQICNLVNSLNGSSKDQLWAEIRSKIGSTITSCKKEVFESALNRVTRENIYVYGYGNTEVGLLDYANLVESKCADFYYALIEVAYDKVKGQVNNRLVFNRPVVNSVDVNKILKGAAAVNLNDIRIVNSGKIDKQTIIDVVPWYIISSGDNFVGDNPGDGSPSAQKNNNENSKSFPWYKFSEKLISDYNTKNSANVFNPNPPKADEVTTLRKFLAHAFRKEVEKYIYDKKDGLINGKSSNPFTPIFDCRSQTLKTSSSPIFNRYCMNGCNDLSTQSTLAEFQGLTCTDHNPPAFQDALCNKRQQVFSKILELADKIKTDMEKGKIGTTSDYLPNGVGHDACALGRAQIQGHRNGIFENFKKAGSNKDLLSCSINSNIKYDLKDNSQKDVKDNFLNSKYGKTHNNVMDHTARQLGCIVETQLMLVEVQLMLGYAFCVWETGFRDIDFAAQITGQNAVQ